MNQIQAQEHLKDLMETFRIAYPMAFVASKDDKQDILEGIGFMLRDAIKEGNTISAAMTAIWFASRAPKPVLLAFLTFLEDGEDSETATEDEWPTEIG